MPYHIERSGSKYKVVSDTGRVMGTHPSKRNAAEQVRALYVNVEDAKKEDVIRMGRRRSGIGDSHSGINTGGAIASTGGAGMGISAADQIKEITATLKSLIEEVPGGTPEGVFAEPTSTYKDCGCETCKAMQVDCPDCPACTPAIVGDGKDAEFEATKPETQGPVVKSMWGGTVFDLKPFVK